jgi:6-phosphogluconolactonase
MILSQNKAVSCQNFLNSESLAIALSQQVAQKLQDDINCKGSALLALSGGKTPIRFFEQLSHQAIDWKAVYITLVDERWVPEDSPRSNAALIKKHLLMNKAKEAIFYPFYDADTLIDKRQIVLEEQLKQWPLPFSVIVLGMGDDGHTASFFPDAAPEQLDKVLCPPDQAMTGIIGSNNSVETRLTLTLPVLLQSRYIALHIEGENKKIVLENAYKKKPFIEMPIRTILNSSHSNFEIFWCP